MFKKGKKNKEEKVNMKKSTVIIIEIVVAVVVLLVALGIIGLYMSRMYLDTQNRPFFIIEDYIESEE